MFSARFSTQLLYPTLGLLLILSLLASPVLAQNGSASGTLWLDTNANGTIDGGDQALSGLQVDLRDDSTGTVILSETTGINGNYFFGSLAAGTYTVLFDASQLPASYTQSYDADGLNTPHQITFPLDPDGSAGLLDFAYIGPADANGALWLDTNANGVVDGGDQGLSNLQILLREDTNGTILTSTTTGNEGQYYFGDLPPGTYTILFDPSQLPASYTQSYDADGLNTPHQITFPLDPGGSAGLLDFAYIGPADANGALWLDANASGTIDGGDQPLPNLQVLLREDTNGTILTSTTTGSGGQYYFGDLPPGTYTILFDPSQLPASYTQSYDADGLNTPHQITFPLDPGGSAGLLDFAYIGPADANGAIWLDANASGTIDGEDQGLPDLEVLLRDDSTGTILTTAITGSEGQYYFGDLPPGTYSILFDPSQLPASYTQSYDADGLNTPHQITFPLDPGSSAGLLDFAYIGPADANGTIWLDANANGVVDAEDQGLPDLDVELRDDSTGTILITETTGSEGQFYFGDLPPGDYSILFDPSQLPAAYTQSYDADGLNTPHQITFPLDPGSSAGLLDFAYIGPADANGTLWLDSNANGLVDAGEPGLSGIHVDLRDDATGALIITETTDSYGQYYFGDLPPGDYTVLLDPAQFPASYSPTYDADGLSTPNQITFPLDPGGSAGLLNFGYAASGLNDGLVGYWPMDDGTGSFADDFSGNGYHAVFSGGPLWTTGYLGGALSFDGQGDALVVGPAPALDAPQTLTMAAWIRHPSSSAWRSILDKRDDATDGYDLYLNTSGQLFLRVGTQTLTGLTSVTDNAWHHVTGIYDGNELRLYVDGVLDAFATVGPLTIDTQADLLLGENYALGNSFFRGELDEVRIYDRALGDLEVEELAAYRNGDLEADLLARWALDEGAGTNASDASGNGNAGTLLGGVTWTTGALGGGLDFDGSSGAVEVLASPTLDAPTTLTMAAWIRHPNIGGWRSIIDKRDGGSDGYDLYLNTSGRLFVRLNNVTLAGTSLVADDTWHHVVAVFDGNQVVLYVDGVEERRTTTGAQTFDTTSSLKLGENWSSGSSFDGVLDDVRVYGRSLTPGEVDQLYRFDGP